MTGRGSGTGRPDDRDLLRQALRALARRSGVDVLLAGLVDDGALTITEFVGTTTDSLERLFVQPGEGVGGGALSRRRPTAVADYTESAHISHQHDEAVRREGLRAMVAVPILVEGSPRAVLYAATREPTPLGDRSADELLRGSRTIAGELRLRDEVDRRIAVLRGTEPSVAADDRDATEAIRVAYGELVALASTTADPALAGRILAITDRLAGTSSPSRGTAAADAPTPLSRRESDVLAQIALGCTYPEAGRRLGLQPGTVKSYMQTVMAKLGVHSRHEAVVAARRLHLLP